jgi:Mg2+ and Co2+ transporter CorA
MSPIPFKKTEEERLYESRSKIRGYKSSIDKTIRNFETLRAQSINAVRQGLINKDMAGAKNAARNVLRNDLAIRYMKSFKLFLENLSITMEFVFTERNINRTLTQANKDLRARMLTDEQASQIQKSIDSIGNSTQELEDRIYGQVDSLEGSLKSFADSKPEAVYDTLQNVAGLQAGTGSGERSVTDKEIDELISKISVEGSATKGQ